MRKRQQSWKSISLFIFSFAISLFLFSNCMPVDDDIAEAKLTFLDVGEITFEKEGGSIAIKLNSNRDWHVTKEADANWIKVSPTKGTEGDATITVEVGGNAGEVRKSTLTITASTIDREITITQNGEEAPIIEYTTIEEIRTLYAESDKEAWTIEEPLQLKAIVISDREGANRPSQRDGFIQDAANNGIAFRVTQSIHTFDMGDALNINLKGATLLNYGGVLQINFSSKAATIISKDVVVAPKELTIEEIVNGAYDGVLVKIKDVQFESFKGLSYYEAGIATNRILENCNGVTIIVKTTKYASFKDEVLPAGNGNVVGIVSLNNEAWQLLIRNLDDVKEMSKDESTRCNSSFITTDKDVLTFDKEGGSEAIHITASVHWSASSNEPWLTVNHESGFNNGLITATVTKNEGAERKASITITNGTINKTVQVIQKAKEASTDVATDLFFSEYVEGSSNNKYLEIYNGTGAIVDLSDYKIELYVNGQSKVKTTEILSGTLDNGKVMVYKHAKAAIYDGEATVSNAINFNGNDAIALVKISTDAYVDIFGSIGHDPGKAWTKSDYEYSLTTMDKTLVRKPSVRSGVTMNPKKGFPTLSVEWIPYPVDTADYLGSHTMD